MNGAVTSVQKVSIPKRKWTRRVAEEIGQNDEVANEADLEATDEGEVGPLIKHRNIRISIGRNTSKESEVVEEGVNHLMKMKGPITPSKVARYNLYDGIVMSDKHVAMPVTNDEKTLILEEESQSKMSEKAKDPEVINKSISHKPTNYKKLNRLTEDFGKCFIPQQELLAEQAFWLRMFDPTSKPSDALPVKIEAPKELPKISLVNECLAIPPWRGVTTVMGTPTQVVVFDLSSRCV
ncbi:hypothetical protein Tco_0257152 [Tanacetum coccineum]